MSIGKIQPISAKPLGTETAASVAFSAPAPVSIFHGGSETAASVASSGGGGGLNVIG